MHYSIIVPHLEEHMLSRTLNLRFLALSLGDCPVSFSGDYPSLLMLDLRGRYKQTAYPPFSSHLNMPSLQQLSLRRIDLEHLFGDVNTERFAAVRELSIKEPIYRPCTQNHSIMLPKLLRSIHALTGFEFLGPSDFLPLGVMNKHFKTLETLAVLFQSIPPRDQPALPLSFITCLSKESRLRDLTLNLGTVNSAVSSRTT